MPKDANGNEINVTLFESYLSKYLIENQQFFEAVYQKILTAIEETITLNISDKTFHRTEFIVTSLMMQECESFTSVKDLKNNFNLFTANYYIKLFCDSIIKKNLVKNAPVQPKQTVPSLSILCQNTLFKDPNDKRLISFLNPTELFHVNHRGVKEIKNPKPVSTKKLGITTLDNTPTDLQAYFPEAYEPSQFDYVPNRDSTVGKWLSSRNLPIITGASGSSRDYLSVLLSIVKLSPQEMKLLIISLAATLVSKGHHSYFEVMIPLYRAGFKLEETPNLFSFYEQTLPPIITTSDSYLKFKHSEVGAILLAKASKETLSMSHNGIN